MSERLNMGNELSTERTMTVKEVANILGVTPEAIKKHVRELFPEYIKDGIETVLTEKQVTEIKSKMIPTTKVVGSTTDIEMEQMTLKVIQYHIQKEQEYKQRAEIAEQKCIEQQPKVEFAETITADEKSTFDMSHVAQELKLSYGKNILFRKLRVAQILKEDNTPYQRYVDSGYFKVYPVPTPVGVKLTTKVTQKGIDFIRKTIKEEN